MAQLDPQALLQSNLCAERPEIRAAIPLSGSSDVQLRASTEPAIRRQMELVWRFQEQLNSYQANHGKRLEPGIVSVSFQCLIDGEAEEVGEVTGVVEL